MRVTACALNRHRNVSCSCVCVFQVSGELRARPSVADLDERRADLLKLEESNPDASCIALGDRWSSLSRAYADCASHAEVTFSSDVDVQHVRQRAIEASAKALQNAEDPLAEASRLGNLARLRYQQKDLTAAFGACERADAACSRIEDKTDRSRELGRLGAIKSELILQGCGAHAGLDPSERQRTARAVLETALQYSLVANDRLNVLDLHMDMGLLGGPSDQV